MVDHQRHQKEPLYVQMKYAIQERIIAGAWAPGALLPTEKQFCDEFKVSRITVRTALQELAREGYIDRFQGKGSIVRKREIHRALPEALGFTAVMKRQGLSPSRKFLSKELVSTRSDLNEFFGFPSDEAAKYWHLKTLRLADGYPVAVMNHYVLKDLGDYMLGHDLENSSFYHLYTQYFGQQIGRSDGVVSASQASAESAALLNKEIGSPLIWFRGITFIEDDRPVEVNYSLFSPDVFQFETKYLNPNVRTDRLNK